jgi:Uncharacterised nucleotidyltransferase
MTSSARSVDPLAELPGPMQAVVALSRRQGADDFAFDQSGFHDAAFQRSLVAIAERLSVLGLVLVELSRSGRLAELESASGLDAVRHLRLTRRQAMIWELERDAVYGQLSRAGVPTVLLKGAALRLTAYHDPAEREFVDIDVLVPKEAIAAAVAALEERGYTLEFPDQIELYLEHHHHLLLKHSRGFVVEVHWALEHDASPFKLDAEAVRRSARNVTTPDGTTVSVPSPEHMVLHLCHQNLENGFSHLRRLVDVDRVVASAVDFDWDMLRLESQRMRVQNVVALSLRLVEVLLGTAVPPGFIESLEISPSVRLHLGLFDPIGVVLEQRGHRHAVQELLKLWCLPDWKSRFRKLTQMATGPEPGWAMIVSEPLIGRRARLTALAKVAAYQASLYPAALLGRRAGARRLFWDRGRRAEG